MKTMILALCLLFTSQVFAFTKIVTAGSMAATITSSTITLASKTGYAMQAVYTGSPVGTLTVEGSNDGTTWSTVTDSTVAVSAAGSTLYNISGVQYELARLLYTFTSGTGSLTVYASSKE